MPKQTGIIPIRGTVGNLTFTKSGKRNGVQEKTHVSEERFKTAKFERVRENATEFTSAANASRVLRDAFHALLTSFKDKKMVRRMHSLMLQIVKADAINGRGERNVGDGPIEMLEGFQFNEKTILSKAFFPDITSVYTRATGEIKIDIEAFVPKFDVQEVPGATHFKLISAAVEIDFKSEETLNLSIQTTPEMERNETETAPASLVHKLAANSEKDVFLLIGIQYYQKIGNGMLYPFKSNEFNALSIVKASRN